MSQSQSKNSLVQALAASAVHAQWDDEWTQEKNLTLPKMLRAPVSLNIS